MSKISKRILYPVMMVAGALLIIFSQIWLEHLAAKSRDFNFAPLYPFTFGFMLIVVGLVGSVVHLRKR